MTKSGDRLSRITQRHTYPYLTRRSILKGAAGVAALSAASIGPWKIAHANERLIVNSYGGSQGKATDEAINKPFEEKFKVKVINDETGTAAQDYAKIRATNGQPGWDVNSNLTPPEVVLGKREGLLLELDEQKVPNLKHVWDKCWEFAPNTGAPNGFSYASLYYNPEKIKEPTSWADYWEANKTYGEDIKGRLLLVSPQSIQAIYNLIMAAKLGGGGVDNMDPAWEYLRNIKDYVGEMTPASAKILTALESGSVWLTPCWSNRAYISMSKGSGMKMVIPKEGTIPLLTSSSVPVGAENKDLALEWINFRLEKEIHKNFCLAYAIGPSRNDMAGEDWPDLFKQTQILTRDQVDGLQAVDMLTLGQKRKDWTLKWQEIMAS